MCKTLDLKDGVLSFYYVYPFTLLFKVEYRNSRAEQNNNNILALDSDTWSECKIDLVAVFNSVFFHASSSCSHEVMRA